MTAYPIVTFAEACADVSAEVPRIPQSQFQPSGAFPIVDQGSSTIAGYTDDPTTLYDGSLPVILFGDHTRRFKFVDFPFAVGADGVKVLSPRTCFAPRFLFHFLLSLNIPSAGYSRHFKFLKRVDVPRPDLENQKRIAGILDMGLKPQSQRQIALDKIGRLSQSIFVEMFGDPVTGSSSMPCGTLSQIGQIITGNTPSREPPTRAEDSVPWVKSDNLGTSVFVGSAAEYVSRSASRRPRIVGKGAVLVSCIAGSPRVIGRSSIADRDVAFNQQINAIVPHSVEPEFLFTQLQLSRRLIQSASTGGMKGMVSKGRLEALPMIVPPKNLQLEFVKRFRGVERLSARMERHSVRLDELFASLQSRVFKGEL